MSPEHAYLHTVTGSCGKCGLTFERHRKRHRDRTDYWREREKKRLHRLRPASDRIIGIDGEGIGREPHRYIYLSAVDEQSVSWSIASEKRLTTVQSLDFILSLPQRSLIFGYGFMYDLTKILEDLDDESLYKLFRPDERGFVKNGRILFSPVDWNGYTVNWLNRRFSVRRGKRSAVVWDVIAFYQSTFVRAIDLWKVATKDEIERIEKMKELRGQFDQVASKDIQAYCQDECLKLANLGRKLIDAHKIVNLPLKRFHGAGSTASVFLDSIGIKEKLPTLIDDMRTAVACAFFGGRFENALAGFVAGPIYSRDLASAYPYSAYHLPCLSHGSWKFVTAPTIRQIEQSRASLVHWTNRSPIPGAIWGPLPVRSREGTIIFPLSGLGGWCWKNEFLAARRISNVECSAAWLFDSDCECGSPFSTVPAIYLERMRLGKDGPGIVLKLALNSGCYGKLAQSRGINPPYQSWIYAGMITSNTRAELLHAIADAPDPSAIIMLATDGLLSTKPLTLREPLFTGTESCSKPLGQWTSKDPIEDGVFLARPGVYFSVNPTPADLEDMKGRGIGKKTLLMCNEGCTSSNCWHDKNYVRIMNAWNRGESDISITLTRFVGAKTGVSFGEKSGYRRHKSYGDWIPYPVKLSFNPQPKRRSFGPNGELLPWQYVAWESVPYREAIKSDEAWDLIVNREIAQEQPEGC